MLKSSRKALSLQLLHKHQERIRGMVTRIENYKPPYKPAPNYNKLKRGQIEKRIEERQKQSDKLFEENMKLIYRIETTGPKIQTKKFPQVKPNPSRTKSLTQRSYSSSASASKPKFRIKDVFRNEDEIFEENMKLITNIECTGPKITCWVNKGSRKMNTLAAEKKREQQKKILEKYREISKQFTKLTKMKSFKRSSSIGSSKSKSRSVLS